MPTAAGRSRCEFRRSDVFGTRCKAFKKRGSRYCATHARVTGENYPKAYRVKLVSIDGVPNFSPSVNAVNLNEAMTLLGTRNLSNLQNGGWVYVV